MPAWGSVVAVGVGVGRDAAFVGVALTAARFGTGAAFGGEATAAFVGIGGLITSTILTLFVLPAISHLLLKGRHKHHVTGDYSDVGPLGGELTAK